MYIFKKKRKYKNEIFFEASNDEKYNWKNSTRQWLNPTLANFRVLCFTLDVYPMLF